MKLQNTNNNALSIYLLLAVFLLISPLVVVAQGKIAFSSDRDGNHEIYVMNSDGSNQTRLTNTIAEELEPSLSADGSRIAFVSAIGGNLGNHQIYVMNSDGTNQTRLTNNTTNDFYQSFSPDGSKIIFSSNRDIFVMNPDGTNQISLTNNQQTNHPWIAVYPTFSPDGSKIAYQRSVGRKYEIYVMNSDGTNQTRLTNKGSSSDESPSWSS